MEVPRSYRKSKYSNCSKPGFRANVLKPLSLALRPGLEHKVKVGSLSNFAAKSLTLLVVILGFSFIFQTSYTNNVSAASITLTIPSDPLSLDISDSSANNGFHKSSASTFSVKTDSSAGYTLSIKAKNNDSDTTKSNDLINSSNNSAKISSILSPVSEADFSSSREVNTWGFLPNKLNGEDNTDFQPGPTNTPSTINKTSAANPDEATSYNLTLAAKVDDSLPSGNYSNTFILTAIANKPSYDAIMQDWDGCETLEEHQTTNLLDTRDNKVYMVSKLKDGKCWMVQNLALGDESLVDRTITSENSDVSNSFVMPVSSTSGFTAGQFDTAWVYVDPTYGGYYSWRAATADTGRESVSSGNASNSICPKGWRLPTSGSGGEFEVMAKKYGSGTDQATSEALRTAPVPGFILSGIYDNSLPSSQGSNGYFWSSSAYNSTYAYFLYLNSLNVYPPYYSNKYYGLSVRCLARDKYNYNITYDLNSGSWSGASPQTGITYDNSITLDSHAPTKSGYTFKGWCSSSSISNNNSTSSPSCNGTTYQPGGTYNLSNDTNNLSLYAMWQKNPACPNAVTSCSYNGYSGKRFGNGPCYMSSDYKSQVEWSSASCPSGWSLPSQSQFNALISSSQAGNGACLYEQGWSDFFFWSSTQYSSGGHYSLGVTRSGAYFSGYNSDYYKLNVRCVSS